LYHHVAHAREGLLFTTWADGALLWKSMIRHAPGAVGLCIMPTHVHLLAPNPIPTPFGRALSAWVRRVQAQRGHTGSIFTRSPEPEFVPAEQRNRMRRYVAINPCRAGLTDDPLAWPLCTVLDEAGFAIPEVRRRVPDLATWFDYLTHDDSVGRRDFPALSEKHDPARLLAAVSQVTRTPLAEVADHRSPVRTLYLMALRTRGLSGPEIHKHIDVSLSTIFRTPSLPPPAYDAIFRLAGRDTVHGLDDDALRRSILRSKYRYLWPSYRNRT
jgi:hypothetical protein